MSIFFGLLSFFSALSELIFLLVANLIRTLLQVTGLVEDSFQPGWIKGWSRTVGIKMLEFFSLFAAGLKSIPFLHIAKPPSKEVLIGAIFDPLTPTLCK